jgi:hypothetical protein
MSISNSFDQSQNDLFLLYLDGEKHRDHSKPREIMSLCTVLEAMWQIEGKKSAFLKPKQKLKP